MKNKVIVVDYGHGGSDPGATNGRLREKDIVLQIGRIITKLLRSQGFTVIETRKGDQTLSLKQRTDIANASNAVLFVSIHVNSFRNDKVNGVETFSHPSSTLGVKLTKNIQDELVKTGLFKSNRGVKTANFYVLRNTNMPASLVELGFIKNSHDINVMTNKQDELAQAVASGILKHLGKSTVSKPSKPSTSSWTKVTGDWTGQTLRQGQYGEPVRQLQELLASKHYYPNKGANNNGVDSYFGADTKDAVERYQSMHGLTVDGLAGRATYASLTGGSSKKNGWKTESGKRYYYKNGVKQTGWLKHGGRWFYLNKDGTMHTGLLKDKGKFYFFNLGGRLTTDQFFPLYANSKGEVYYKNPD